MSHHQGFADSLLAVQPVCPPGLTAWNRSDPGRRFGVYRNNVMASLIDALADTCPVTQALVGEAFFRAMAAVFARANPPHSPVMAHYGRGFAEFIEGFPAAAGLPYLADVARLEILRVQAYHAADAACVSPAALALLLSTPERLPGARLTLHPSLRHMDSPYAVVSLWAAHQSEDVDSAVRAVDVALRECALLVRVGLDVEIHRIATGTAVFIRHLDDGLGLGDAAGRAMATDPAFVLTDALALLLGVGAITAITDLTCVQQWGGTSDDETRKRRIEGPPLPSASRPTAGFAQPAGCGGAPHASRIPASPPHGEASNQLASLDYQP